MDAEYIAGAEAAKEAVWIRNFINDLQMPGIHVDTVPLYIDNNSAVKLTTNPEFHSRSKHIDVKHHFIREKAEEGVINSQRIGTTDNLADVFTKALPKFLRCLRADAALLALSRLAIRSRISSAESIITSAPFLS
jgi:hypothetical protein